MQPGPIDTDANPDAGEFAESLNQVTAQGRYGQTSDVPALMSFLAGPDPETSPVHMLNPTICPPDRPSNTWMI